MAGSLTGVMKRASALSSQPVVVIAPLYTLMNFSADHADLSLVISSRIYQVKTPAAGFRRVKSGDTASRARSKRAISFCACCAPPLMLGVSLQTRALAAS